MNKQRQQLGRAPGMLLTSFSQTHQPASQRAATTTNCQLSGSGARPGPLALASKLAGLPRQHSGLAPRRPLRSPQRRRRLPVDNESLLSPTIRRARQERERERETFFWLEPRAHAHRRTNCCPCCLPFAVHRSLFTVHGDASKDFTATNL